MFFLDRWYLLRVHCGLVGFGGRPGRGSQGKGQSGLPRRPHPEVGAELQRRHRGSGLAGGSGADEVATKNPVEFVPSTCWILLLRGSYLAKTIKHRATNWLIFSPPPSSRPIFFLRGREEVLKFVKGLHGFGDYAAGNVAMLLGFYEEVPLDSETVSLRRTLPFVFGPRSRSLPGVVEEIVEEKSEARRFSHAENVQTQNIDAASQAKSTVLETPRGGA